MSEAAAFTAAEVAFVLREPVKTIKKALDEGPIQAKLVKKPGGAVRAIDWADVLYLFALRTLRNELTPKARTEFYHALKRVPVERTHEVRFGRLSIAIDDLKAEVQNRARELAKLAEKVEFRRDGEAILKGTDVEVYRVAALLAGGMTPEEIRHDYPSLSPDAVVTAKAYAEAHPKTGRPYPAKTVKRAIKGAGLEALDEVLDEEK
ncbi:DUF433 domain-containing protein [Methylocystis sp. JAN1]|uniref:DUF433 domain-containing protein n=1 Tax=Methylocystis sp. JAN1 TaxID=3397211 RepID=UPI003FA2D8A6